MRILSDTLFVASRTDRMRRHAAPPLSDRRVEPQASQVPPHRAEEALTMYARHNDAFAPQPAETQGARTATDGFGRPLLAWIERLKRSRIDRRAEAALASMDEHLLRDIGAHRGDIARLVRGGRD